MVHLSEFENFVHLHENQLLSSNVPKHFWESLYRKITTECFDSGNTFTLIQIEYDDDDRGEHDPIYQVQVNTEEGVDHMNPEHIYLVDHCWTFRVENARNTLLCMADLRNRMATLMGLYDSDEDVLVDKIFDEMWKYVNTYAIANADSVEDRIPIWYVMDEVGSGIHHSDVPNFRMVPFIYLPQKIAYSLIFPVKDLEFAEVVTRDYGEGWTGDRREAYLLPWIPVDLRKHSFAHVEPSPDYFLGGHISETLPVLSNFESPVVKKSCYKVYSEYEFVRNYLNDTNFEIVESEEEADILWYTRHFKSFEELSMTPHKFVNQFPFEYILTVKDLLSITCRRRNSNNEPAWLPTTYNLKTELVQFVSYFQTREDSGADNHWIIKPFNLARGLDTHITKNLSYIMRLTETGPKIAQKYIEKPVLFGREECGDVKFDLRYVILLKNVKPLQVYVYKNFFLRFANRPFEMTEFHLYDKHFTVMNYNKDTPLKRMLCDEFKMQWERQYPSHGWDDVEASILKMLRAVFECAALEPPPCGISESPQSRALYAADIMLEWDNGEVQPKLLEVNWTPDCQRACEYYPNFYNDIFNLLFRDVENDAVFHNLKLV